MVTTETTASATRMNAGQIIGERLLEQYKYPPHSMNDSANAHVHDQSIKESTLYGREALIDIVLSPPRHLLVLS